MRRSLLTLTLAAHLLAPGLAHARRLAPPDPDEEAVRSLQRVALYHESRLQGRCEAPSAIPDLAAKADAQQAMALHAARITFALEVLQARPEEVLGIALHMADDALKAHDCDPSDPGPVRAALERALALRAALTTDAGPLRQVLEDRIRQLELRAAPPPAPASLPEVRVVHVEGEVRPVEPSLAPLDRLALRVELVGAWHRLDAPGTREIRAHAGVGVHLAMLARFPLGARRRYWLLFGPHLGRWSLTPKDHEDVQVHAMRVGGRVELEISPSPKLARWLTIHPGLELGFGVEMFRGSGVGKLYVAIAASAHLCSLRGLACVGLRVMPQPGLTERLPPGLQLALGVDLMRASAWLLEHHARRTRLRSRDVRSARRP